MSDEEFKIHVDEFKIHICQEEETFKITRNKADLDLTGLARLLGVGSVGDAYLTDGQGKRIDGPVTLVVEEREQLNHESVTRGEGIDGTS